MGIIFQFVEYIAFAVIVFALIFSLFLALKARRGRLSAETLLAQERLDSIMLKQQIGRLSKEIEEIKLQNTDGFIKFVSQSRDWAFEYIEGVQEALLEFSNSVESDLEYHKTYGQVLGTNVHTQQLDKIVIAYEKLKSVMPEADKK